MRRRRSRGQAMIMAIVGLLILAIGMYTSYNLSRAVYEKIQLQNAADATAYSLATMEARTFNFIAFANRAQVANYVQMMEAQSLLSSATFFEGLTAWGAELAQVTGKLLQAFNSTRPLGVLLVQLGEILETQYDTWMKQGVSLLSQWAPRFIQLQTVENQALTAVSALMVLATGLQVADGAHHIALANDPDARRTWISYALNGVNAVSYTTAFDPAVLKWGRDDADVEAAKRVMVELGHAARIGTPPGTPSDFILARGPFSLLDNLLAHMQGAVDQGGSYGRHSRRFLGRFVDALNDLAGDFVGTTKMLTSDSGGEGLPALDDTDRSEADHSGLSRGDALAAKDTVQESPTARLFPVWRKSNTEMFAAVVSTPFTGLHCRYDKSRVRPTYGSVFRLLSLWNGREFHCERDDKQKWRALIGRGGIQPYLKFAPKLSGFGAERRSFNQPDVWVFLNKPPEAMELAGGKDLEFEIGSGRDRASLDARIAEDGALGLGGGINVLARAQVYYHRPGAWREPPNFFNPFWGARLAPKNVAIKRLGSKLGLGGVLSQLIGDNVWMH